MISGQKLFLVLALALSGCRTSNPPVIDICLGDGFGGGDCKLRVGSRLRAGCMLIHDDKYYCPPTLLKNAWMTTQEDMAAYAAWAADADVLVVNQEMGRIETEIKAP